MKVLIISVCLVVLSYGCGSDLNISGITQTQAQGWPPAHYLIPSSEVDEDDWCGSSIPIGMHPAVPNPAHVHLSADGVELMVHPTLTRINFSITRILEVIDIKIQIINKKRKVVRNLLSGNYPPGRNQAVWNLKNNSGEIVGPGMYRVQLFHDDNLVCHGDIQIIHH